MDKDKLAPALGRITSGLYIATGKLDGEPVGMLCSFVEQAGFHPPMLTVALDPDRRLVHAVVETKRMGLNVLSTENQRLIGPFANPNNEEPFDGVTLVENASGLPQLDGVLAFLQCEYRGELPAGDHHVYLFEVVDGELMNDDFEPMVRIRKNGFNY